MQNKRLIEARRRVKTRYGYKVNDGTAKCIPTKPSGDHLLATGNFVKHLYKVNGHSRLCRRCGSGESMALAS